MSAHVEDVQIERQGGKEREIFQIAETQTRLIFR